MKKVLSIVLALAMVLCMIPALAAEEKTKTEYKNKSYYINVYEASKGDKIASTKEKTANSITAEYEYDADKAVSTGKWTEGKMMSVVSVAGFSFDKNDDVTVTINSKKLDVSQNALYVDACGAIGWTYKDGYGVINFPAELTEAGYTEKYYINATWTRGNVEYEEYAVIEVKFVNTKEADKGSAKAYITNIAKNSKETVDVVVYIVGSKIYADFAKEVEDFDLDITFADENKAAFTGITYAYDTETDDGVKAIDITPKTTKLKGDDKYSIKLAKSVGKFAADVSEDPKDIQFTLETEAKKYTVDKKYTLICRSYIHEEDPKGIYLEKSDVTIAVGEEYTPVIKAISNGAALTPSSILIYDSFGKFNTAVLDYVGDQYDNKVIGVKPGVAYIKVTYGKDYAKDSFFYTSSAQKITVTLPGASTPAQSVEYTVTCRNLNVRKGAGTSFAKAGMVHRGDKLAVVEIANGWAKLADGTFVCAKYITK